jgi:hypothetical protein
MNFQQIFIDFKKTPYSLFLIHGIKEIKKPSNKENILTKESEKFESEQNMSFEIKHRQNKTDNF